MKRADWVDTFYSPAFYILFTFVLLVVCSIIFGAFGDLVRQLANIVEDDTNKYFAGSLVLYLFGAQVAYAVILVAVQDKQQRRQFFKIGIYTTIALSLVWLL